MLFHCISASTAIGGLYLLLLFGLCFGAVAGGKALYLAKHRPAPPPEPKQKQPERVYYLVEKRRTNAKNAYKAPKEISFAQSAPRHEDKGAQAQSSKRRTLSPSPQSRSK